eukprot:1142036-Rhodomonas_salina.1
MSCTAYIIRGPETRCTACIIRGTEALYGAPQIVHLFEHYARFTELHADPPKWLRPTNKSIPPLPQTLHSTPQTKPQTLTLPG